MSGGSRRAVAAATLLAPVLIAPGAGPLHGQRAPVDVQETALSLGTLEGAPEEQFFQVRNPLMLSGGRVVVPDAGGHEIRVFDAEGRLLASAGREGDGPGEYRSIDWALPYRGDSLVVFDSRLQRLTVLTEGGERGRVLTLGAGGGPSRTGGSLAGRPPARSFAVGVFDDGGFLVRHGEVSARPGDTTAVLRERHTFARVDPEGGHVADVVRLPDDEQFVWAEGGSRSVRPRAFGRTTAVAVRGDRVFVADNTGFRVVVLDAVGDTLDVLESARPGRPVTDADRDRWLAAELEKLGDGFLRRIGEAALRGMSFPRTMPFHGEMVVGSDGRVWLEEYRPPHAGEAPTWTVFTPDGSVAARLRFPRGFRLTWASSTRALGVLEDELGVERVVAWVLPG